MRHLLQVILPRNFLCCETVGKPWLMKNFVNFSRDWENCVLLKDLLFVQKWGDFAVIIYKIRYKLFHYKFFLYHKIIGELLLINFSRDWENYVEWSLKNVWYIFIQKSGSILMRFSVVCIKKYVHTYFTFFCNFIILFSQIRFHVNMKKEKNSTYLIKTHTS